MPDIKIKRYADKENLKKLMKYSKDTFANKSEINEKFYTKEQIDTKLTTYSKNGHTHDDRYYTEAEVNNLLAGKANTSHTHNSVRSPDNNHVIGLDWSSQSSGFVGLSVDSNKQGGVVTTANLSKLLGGIGVYDIGSTILALTGTWVDYGHIIAGSGLRYAALNKNGGIYNLDINIGATGTWVKVSGNSSETSGFGLYRRIA